MGEWQVFPASRKKGIERGPRSSINKPEWHLVLTRSSVPTIHNMCSNPRRTPAGQKPSRQTWLNAQEHIPRLSKRFVFRRAHRTTFVGGRVFTLTHIQAPPMAVKCFVLRPSGYFQGWTANSAAATTHQVGYHGSKANTHPPPRPFSSQPLEAQMFLGLLGISWASKKSPGSPFQKNDSTRVTRRQELSCSDGVLSQSSQSCTERACEEDGGPRGLHQRGIKRVPFTWDDHWLEHHKDDSSTSLVILGPGILMNPQVNPERSTPLILSRGVTRVTGVARLGSLGSLVLPIQNDQPTGPPFDRSGRLVGHWVSLQTIFCRSVFS